MHKRTPDRSSCRLETDYKETLPSGDKFGQVGISSTNIYECHRGIDVVRNKKYQMAFDKKKTLTLSMKNTNISRRPSFLERESHFIFVARVYRWVEVGLTEGDLPWPNCLWWREELWVEEPAKINDNYPLFRTIFSTMILKFDRHSYRVQQISFSSSSKAIDLSLHN